ncbi:pyrroline-5-carboxylate reductase [Soehngenia longivitae]|uniref:Pyrroline-5-carboxylate reductase n=1 Tax=Soehngenia longivitae TaxID=2562294 RepID=A0A4Z0D8E0_9FIRM|nr:pyrroline-5-carboxylate reductase [Soehngenia longivitae]TFZ41141.1 pyrroline-5-carboxylate reductase [Soehngenia longivitae]
MNKIIGFIGAGNMGEAMIRKLIEYDDFKNENIIATAKTVETRNKIKNTYNIKVLENTSEVAKYADYLVLAVKPHQYENILNEIRGSLKENAIVISIAAGISSNFMRKNLNKNTKFVNIMPNTPVMVGEGMIALYANESLDTNDINDLLSIFSIFGKVEVVEEDLMDAVTAVSGSSPAFVYVMIESMADAAVLMGMKRDVAYTFAAQAVLGAAKMVLETKEHPGILKDKVCSPGGTTIEGIKELEEKNFRAAVIDASVAVAKKSKSMNK